MRTQRLIERRRACGPLVLSLVAAGVLGGCTYDHAAVNAFLQEPRQPVSGVEYRVYPPDALAIHSLHVPEINGIAQEVRPDGRINLPLLGEVAVAGKTPAEIEEALEAIARKYYEEVDATVDVTGYNSQSFYVMGQVGRPGPMRWTGRDTLLDALARAQPTTLAWPERIVLVRAAEPQVGGQASEGNSPRFTWKGERPNLDEKGRKKMLFNLNAMVKSGDLSRNVLLQPNDVIYVQPNPLAKVGLAIQNLLFPVRPAVETVGLPARTVGAAALP